MRESWLPAAPESASRARALVGAAAHEQGLGDDGAWSLMLATSEAVSNAILHGTPCSEGDEGILVRLLPGLLADLVVLDRDPFAVEPEELPELQVVATMVGGRWTHNPPPWD